MTATSAPEFVPRTDELLYERRAQPDERLLHLLETQLTQRGYQVFIDRPLTVLEEWTKSIERELLTADLGEHDPPAGSAASGDLVSPVRSTHAPTLR